MSSSLRRTVEKSIKGELMFDRIRLVLTFDFDVLDREKFRHPAKSTLGNLLALGKHSVPDQYAPQARKRKQIRLVSAAIDIA